MYSYGWSPNNGSATAELTFVAVHGFQYYQFLLDDGSGGDGMDDAANEGDVHPCLLEELDSMELVIVGIIDRFRWLVERLDL
jgi:hypothetical protein